MRVLVGIFREEGGAGPFITGSVQPATRQTLWERPMIRWKYTAAASVLVDPPQRIICMALFDEQDEQSHGFLHAFYVILAQWTPSMMMLFLRLSAS